jgi:hypothetical protein
VLKVSRVIRGALVLGTLATALAVPSTAQATPATNFNLDVWTDPDMGGRHFTYASDESDVSWQGMNDQISTVQTHDFAWCLYQDTKFMGTHKSVGSGGYVPNLKDWGFDNKISSVRQFGLHC